MLFSASAKNRQPHLHALASITSLSSFKSIKPIPVYFPDLNRASELAPVLTGC